jgi:hypothetical protein
MWKQDQCMLFLFIYLQFNMFCFMFIVAAGPSGLGNIESEAVKYGHESQGTWSQE